jgi:hypothetical protein
MKRFLKNIALRFLIPLLIVIFLLVAWDPFRVFFNYDDFYTNNRIVINREYVCYQLFQRNKKKFDLENFIIGNSRSQAYKTTIWSKIIGVNNVTCFHYDGSNMGLYRAKMAIKFVLKNVKNVKNLLLVVDTDFFSEVSEPKWHLQIQPPAISREYFADFYFAFLKSSLDFKFLLANSIFYLSEGKVHFDFMHYYFSESKENNKSNNITGDFWPKYDEMIKKDSIGYYSELFKKGIFYGRSKTEKQSPQTIKEEQKKMLVEIKNIIEQEKINIKIVISPLYDQLKFNRSDLAFLKNMFGSKNVFDFSGINYITNNPLNYYESSHYKPYVANTIMNYVYNLKTDKLDVK